MFFRDDDLANVDAPEEGLGTFYGMVLRSTLILVLKLKAFGPRKDKEVDAPVLVPKQQGCLAFLRAHESFSSLDDERDAQVVSQMADH